MVGNQVLLAACVSLKSLLSLGSVLLFPVRPRDISPGLSSGEREQPSSQPFLRPSLIR